jgi:hypothetical protein
MTSEDFIPSQPYGVERQFQIYCERTPFYSAAPISEVWPWEVNREFAK